MKKKVSILIPTRFDSRYTIELAIRSIQKYTDYPYKIIIGDAGVDNETQEYLSTQQEITVVKCPDSQRPKQFLAEIVDTPYFIFLHDDTQILKQDWLIKRIKIMESNPYIGIVGPRGYNYVNGWKRLISLSPLKKRFFPLGLLVRKETQDALGLFWGKIEGFDTGAIAYLQFLRQKKWKFINFEFKKDIKHWWSMTWIMRSEFNREYNPRLSSSFDYEAIKNIRNQKMLIIKEILSENKF